MEMGKKIASIWFSSGEKLLPGTGGTLEIVVEGHGMYDMEWIVQKNKEGRETSRHNPIFVESIVWETENENPAKEIP